MANTNDITDVVKGIVKTYIKPKNPIYKVNFVLSYINYDYVETETKSVLAEESNKTNLLGADGSHATISREIVKTWKQIIKNGFTPSIKLEEISLKNTGRCCTEHDAIINICRLEQIC